MGDSSQHRPCSFGCGVPVPAELATEGLCILHYTVSVERACAEMRRETVVGRASAARRAEIANYVAAAAVNLARVASASAGLSDEVKKRALATFLTLMNLRENLDRAASRCAPSLGASQPVVAPASVVALG
jgi:hypothetical protein